MADSVITQTTPFTRGKTGQPWQRQYSKRLRITDVLAVTAAVFTSQAIWIGSSTLLFLPNGQPQDMTFTYTTVSVVVILVWLGFLSYYATRDQKVVGSGTVEYRRTVDATVRFFGILAIAAYLARVDLGRGYFLTALPLGIALLLLTRWIWRQWLHRQQRAGRCITRALLIGQSTKTQHVVEAMLRDGATGLQPIGALTKNGAPDPTISVPVLGRYADSIRFLGELDIEAVILTGADDISPKEMRRLGWALESQKIALIVAPALTDVAGPRIHARPVAGLPLIHVDFPVFEGRKRVAKRIFDIISSVTILILLSPVLLAIAIAVKASGPGAVLYRQTRVGLRGEEFGMLKFRSMVQGADDQLASLLDAQGTSDSPLFKVMNDPRITPVGRFIRKYSLDEFPQLINVLLGHMSLVGPRPQREAEVALYDDAAHRRLFMKPGMSGLWQVSGRSSLSWEDSIRLDLYYVENWSLTADFVILWKTFRAVVAPGAEDAH